ncbi:DUF4352 domain-containing protein [uncultured Williamsia sp.]|uniref:DUF4352 domain-containing protein n=1 Tax=uncultured Williamsia sp. TaxID=259311 RepID=UPI00260C9DB2|nr:DUF4352 domain-containing protein [uncultured Williamsia sp.]
MNRNPSDPHQPESFVSPYPPPAPRKNWFARHKVLSVLGGLVLLIVVISVATSGGGSTDSPDAAPAGGTAPASAGASATSAESAAAPRPGIGAPARDGKFEFVVRGVRPGGTSIGPDFMAERAQGEFLLVDLTVRNVGDKAQSLDISSQKVLSAQGTEYSPNTAATIQVDDAAVFYEQINPGNALQVTVVYDLPAGTDATQIELHDSVFSGGVTVDLR